MSLQLSRDQRIVLALYESEDKEPSEVAKIVEDTETMARVQSLPAMVLRHGVMLTLEYLDGKAKGADGKKKPDLAALVRKGIREALPTYAGKTPGWPTATDLAKLPLMHYVAVQDAAIAVATWLKRLVDAYEARSPTSKGAKE